MSAVIVVQARMGSSRLPGKVLARAGGHVLLALMLDRLAAARLAPVVVATSERGADDAVVAAMAGRPERVVRGSEPDVLDRVLQAAAATHAEHVIRLTADCPLIDPRVIGDVYDTHLAVGADYTSNTLLRTFPDGLDVEVVRRSALAEAAAEATAPVEREHVTPFIVRRPGRYRLAAHVGPLDAEDERWTIDEPADLHWLDELLTRRPELADAGWMEILDVIGRARDPEAGEAVLRVDRTGRGARPADARVLGSAPAPPPLPPRPRTW
ncbi:MAG: cytidylyltransferase domain-containing protein, partial [Acidimicrobiales bacterium]